MFVEMLCKCGRCLFGQHKTARRRFVFAVRQLRGSYPLALKKFPGKHRSINHSAGYYVTGEAGEIHTNTIESAFSLFKRGILGNYHFVSIKHLHRYLAEFEHRFNERKNPERFQLTLQKMVQSEPIQFAELTA